MTTEPTDDELDEILCGQWPAFSMQATLVRMWVRQAMRDAITRLGQPAVASEPVAWRYRMKGDLQWQYTERKEQFAHADEIQPLHATPQPTQAHAVNQADRPFIVRLAEDFAEDCVMAGYVTTKAASYGRLMDEALSTRAQAGPVPLTDEQIAAIWAQKPRYHAAPIGETDIEFARAIEAAHGIKGGQHES